MTRLAGNVLLLVFVSLGAVCLAELAVRRLAPVYPGIYQPDSLLLHTLVPSGRKRFVVRPENGGGSVDVRIDSLGFRGPEITWARTPGVRRVVVFGDSYVEGEYAPDSITFVRQLERSLTADVGGRVEAVNAGVVGYGPDQELLRMHRDLPRLKPDLAVVVVFADNDFGDLLRDKLFRLDSSRATLLPNAHRLSPSVVDELTSAVHPRRWNRLMLVRLIRKIRDDHRAGAASRRVPTAKEYLTRALRDAESEYTSAVVRRDPVVTNLFRDHYDADIALTPDSPSARYKVALMNAVFRAMYDTASALGVPLLVVTVPSGLDACEHFIFTVDSVAYPRYARRRLSGIADDGVRAAGLPLVSLFDPFRTAGACDMYLKGGDSHWSPRGQALAARLVATEVKRLGLLTPVMGRAASRP